MYGYRKYEKKIVDVYARWPEIAGYYKGKIYYVDGSSGGNLMSLSVSDEKIKTAYDDSYVFHYSLAQNGKYIYFAAFKTVCRYNAQTGKIKKIGKMSGFVNGPSLIYDTSTGYVYYVKWVKATDDAEIISVMRCKSDGSKKKTVAKNIKINSNGVKRLTANSITYYDSTGLLKTRKY